MAEQLKEFPKGPQGTSKPGPARPSLPQGVKPPAGKSTPTRDYRPALLNAFEGLSLFGGLAPQPQVQAQAMLLSVHGQGLAHGANELAKSSKIVNRLLDRLCGDPNDANDAGTLGIIVAVAAITPFLQQTVQLWSPPAKTVRDKGTNQMVPNPERARYDETLRTLAEAANRNSTEFFRQAQEQFVAQQKAEEERLRAEQNGQAQS